MRLLSIALISVALLLQSWSATAAIRQTVSPSEQNQSDSAKISVEALRTRIDSILSREPLASGAVGLLAVNLRGDTLACYHPNTKLVPASNIKILTTGVALRVLGSQYRFTTSIGYSGSISPNGELNGDLYIIGGGDPTTGARIPCATPVSNLFAQWHNYIKDAGITGINGRIIADPRFFSDTTPENLAWNYDDISAYYGAGPSGLNFFENAQHFLVRPAHTLGQTPSFSISYPQTPWLEVSSIATTGQPRSDNTIFLINSSLSPLAQFAGSFPIDRKAYTIKGSNRFGALTCAYYFHSFLQERGVSVTSAYADISPTGYIRTFSGNDTGVAAPQSELTIIGRSESASIASIIYETNHESDNFFAETLLKMIGIKRNGSDEDDKCLSALQSELVSMGLSPENRCKTTDGSGLARTNYVSPGFFVDFLKAMTREKEAEIYYRSLPSPGEKGSLETKVYSCLGPYTGRLRMKSGSMNGIRCYSGYIFPTS